MVDQVDINEEIVTKVMKKLLPTMDAQTVTLSNLLEHIQKVLCIEKKDLKPWKPLIKVLVGELLHLCPNGTPTKISKPKQTSTTSISSPTSPVATPDDASHEKESKQSIGSKSTKMAQKRISKRIMINESDEEEATQPTQHVTSKSKVEMKMNNSGDHIDEENVNDEVENKTKRLNRANDDSDEGSEGEIHTIRNPIKKSSRDRKIPSSDEDDIEEEFHEPSESTKISKQKRRKSSSIEDDNDGESSGSDDPRPKRKEKKRKLTTKDNDSKKKRAAKPKKETKSTAPTSTGLESLKQMARIAGVLAPVIYKKLRDAESVADAEEILRNRLDQANISWSGQYPSKSDMAALKRKKDLARELDGIDTSLIIDSSRGSRRNANDAYIPTPSKQSDDSSDDGSEASFDANTFGNDGTEDESDN